MNDKEYWEYILGLVLFIYATYTITKDLVTEKTVPIITTFFNSPTESAIFYAGILDIIVFVVLIVARKTILKKL